MRRLTLLVVFAASVAAPATGAAFTTSDRVLPMDDGVGIATTTYIPSGSGPFPAIVMFHGLGGNRQSLAPIASRFADAGYVVLTSDFRGHGQSGGLFSGLGARELADAAALRERWLPELAPIDNARVGAWGISLGGGAALRSIGEGEPYAALEVVETWRDLYQALVPQNLPKSGALFGFLGAVPRERQSPELLAVQEALSRGDTSFLRSFSQARSSTALLGRSYPPTIFFQGRRDFAFGLEQGIAAYAQLTEPKRLYIGPFGHAPSSFPGPDVDAVIRGGLQWYDRFLKGLPNGADTQPPVELAPAPYTGTSTHFRGLPPTITRTYRFARAKATIRDSGKVVRRVRLARLTETFGAPTVRVRASSTTGWSHLVAVLAARAPNGAVTVVSEGGVPTRLGAKPRTVTIRLISQATTIPKGSRLELTLAGTSTAQDPGNLLYLIPVPQGANVTIGTVQLAVPVLKQPVSR